MMITGKLWPITIRNHKHCFSLLFGTNKMKYLSTLDFCTLKKGRAVPFGVFSNSDWRQSRITISSDKFFIKSIHCSVILIIFVFLYQTLEDMSTVQINFSLTNSHLLMEKSRWLFDSDIYIKNSSVLSISN